MINVLDDHDTRLCHRLHMIPPVHAIQITVSLWRRSRATNTAGHRVPDHRWQRREDAPNTRISEAFVTEPQIESLYGVRDCAGVQSAKGLQPSTGQLAFHR